MYVPVLVTPPDAQPVTLAEAKLHLRIDGNDEDSLVCGLIDAAVSYFDGWSGVLGRCLVNQVWAVSLPAWPGESYRLPFPDVSSVGIVYRDSSGAEQSIPTEDYAVLSDSRGSFLRFAGSFSSPAHQPGPSYPITLSITAGYGDHGDCVPAAIRAAIMLMIGHLYLNREAVSPGSTSALPLGVQALIEPYRRVGV